MATAHQLDPSFPSDPFISSVITPGVLSTLKDITSFLDKELVDTYVVPYVAQPIEDMLYKYYEL
jgi:hypothetical protein